MHGNEIVLLMLKQQYAVFSLCRLVLPSHEAAHGPLLFLSFTLKNAITNTVTQFCADDGDIGCAPAAHRETVCLSPCTSGVKGRELGIKLSLERKEGWQEYVSYICFISH